MKRYFSRYSLNIFSLERKKWEFPTHNHNFYEIIFIEKGKGMQILNDVIFPYSKGDVFFLTPNDHHSFEIEKKTTFTFIKFTEQLFIEKNEHILNTKWQRKIDAVIFNPNVQPTAIFKNSKEKKKVFQLLNLLKLECEIKDVFNRQIILELFGVMISLIVRNLDAKEKHIIKKKNIGTDKVNSVLTYVRQNIFEKDKITIATIAETFYASPNYIGIFIKKHTGMSLRQIILETKLKTAERLLCNSELTISEIANRLQFTDSSHFTKIFKKYRGKTPKVFRT